MISSLSLRFGALAASARTGLRRRLAQWVGGPVAASGAATSAQSAGAAPASDQLTPHILTTARALAAYGPRRVVLPSPDRDAQVARSMRVGFIGNIANNAYNAVVCLRRCGVDAELVLEDGWFDRFVMNRPFWEDVEVRCANYEDGLSSERKWRPVPFVRRVAYDVELQVRYQNRLSAIEEVQAEYKAAFATDLAADRALVLAQFMGHWPLLLSMARYDVVQFSGEATLISAFCPRPYVVYPTGSDLYVSPFDETLAGVATRAGYTGADEVLAGEPGYGRYLQRLPARSWRPAPIMIDTTRYLPGEAAATRARWLAAVGGSRFLLCSCRQAWKWKANDVLVRAFAAAVKDDPVGWRLVLQDWGPDTQRTRDLISALRIAHLVHWEPLCSKPVLRTHQRAADLCADQLAYDSAYGTSVLEAMAAGKPVIVRPVAPDRLDSLPSPPPFIAARDAASATEAIVSMFDDRRRADAGAAHLAWVRAVHGYDIRHHDYVATYRRVSGWTE